MDFITLPIGNKMHIVTRATDETVEVLCQPQWTFAASDVTVPNAETLCNVCKVQLDRIIAATAAADPVPYGQRSGTVLTMTDPTPETSAMTPGQQQAALDDASDERAIQRAPWYVRLLRTLRIA